MTAMFNIPEKSTNTQPVHSGFSALRLAIAGAVSAWFGPRARLDNDANQIELRQVAHHRREEIRRATDELRRLGVRN